MKFPTVRSYSLDQLPSAHTFYILSKGCNAGKPGFQPWRNSFEIICEVQEEYDFYYWLTSAIFSARLFYAYQKGSVIPFITKGDLVKLLQQMAASVDKDSMVAASQKLASLLQLEETLHKQLHLIASIKLGLIHQALKSRQ